MIYAILFYRILVSAILLVFLVSCGLPSFSSILNPTPTEEPKGPKDLSKCSDENLPNWYTPLDSYGLSNSFYAKFPPIGTGSFDQALLPSARFDAFVQLVDIVKKWTTSIDIPISTGPLANQHFVRVTLTFISPELIEIVLLNQYLN